jgi:NADPH:quinone reductase-like Zn-dependent oxidoreductase
VKLPHILGSDIAGEIVEVGEYIAGFQPGQRVLLAPMHFCNRCEQCVSGRQNLCPEFTVLGNGVDGGNCELIAVPAVNVIPIPDSMTFIDAASVPLVFLTAFHMLTGRAAIRPGQTVLVLGANSGVGIAAIQLAKLYQATVIATAGDDRKAELAKKLGADYVVNHYQQKIGEEARKITGRVGVDIVVEHVGAATWNESMKALRPGGTLVTCGATSGPEASFDLRFLFAASGAARVVYGDDGGCEVLRLVFSGKLKPVVDRTFPLSEVRAAHEYLGESKMFGKVVLVP